MVIDFVIVITVIKKIVLVFQRFLKGTGLSKYYVTNIIERR